MNSRSKAILSDKWKTNPDNCMSVHRVGGPTRGSQERTELVLQINGDNLTDKDRQNIAQQVAAEHNLFAEMRNELSYAIAVFEESCDCGECGPCERLIGMKELLEKSLTS